MTRNRPNPVFVTDGSPVLSDLDDRDIRVVAGSTKKNFSTTLGGYGNYVSGTTTEAATFVTGEEGEFGLLTPSLGDISIVLPQTIDYTTNPPTVEVIFKVKNSTNKIVKSIKARINN